MLPTRPPASPPRGDPAHHALKREPTRHPTPFLQAERDLSPERLGSAPSHARTRAPEDVRGARVGQLCPEHVPGESQWPWGLRHSRQFPGPHAPATRPLRQAVTAAGGKLRTFQRVDAGLRADRRHAHLSAVRPGPTHMNTHAHTCTHTDTHKSTHARTHTHSLHVPVPAVARASPASHAPPSSGPTRSSLRFNSHSWNRHTGAENSPMVCRREGLRGAGEGSGRTGWQSGGSLGL